MRLIRPKARAGARVVGGTWFMELNNVGFVGDPWWSMFCGKNMILLFKEKHGGERERETKKKYFAEV